MLEAVVQEVFDFIEANYRRSISLRDVAQSVGYSPAYLTDLIRRQTGQPVHSWIIERRMTAARCLLLETNQPVARIAERVGYRDIGYFFRQFRQRHGTPPQTWRNAQRDGMKLGLTQTSEVLTQNQASDQRNDLNLRGFGQNA